MRKLLIALLACAAIAPAPAYALDDESARNMITLGMYVHFCRTSLFTAEAWDALTQRLVEVPEAHRKELGRNIVAQIESTGKDHFCWQAERANLGKLAEEWNNTANNQ
jgi:hypothetical protein